MRHRSVVTASHSAEAVDHHGRGHVGGGGGGADNQVVADNNKSNHWVSLTRQQETADDSQSAETNNTLTHKSFLSLVTGFGGLLTLVISCVSILLGVRLILPMRCSMLRGSRLRWRNVSGSKRKLFDVTPHMRSVTSCVVYSCHVLQQPGFKSKGAQCCCHLLVT